MGMEAHLAHASRSLVSQVQIGQLEKQGTGNGTGTGTGTGNGNGNGNLHKKRLAARDRNKTH